ncbi:MAG: hypothetical protein AAF942_01510 [Pseudomonadota bacterium]
MVTFPIAPFLVGSDLTPIEQKFEHFIAGLTSWRPRADSTGLSEPPKLQIEANGFEAALDKMNRQFLVNMWGDGLPLSAPTDARVDWILKGTDLPRDHVVGKVMPRGGIATVETIAVSLAMAGGRPEYLPVLIGAMSAILSPEMDHDKWQATSGSTYPVVIVNGPAAQQIRLNSGFGLLGPDPQHPAGASIGRAIRLLQQNAGGALPGVGTMAMFGGMRYTNAVFAEDEEGLPEGWSPLCTTQWGLPAGTNSVTVFVGTSATNILRRGVGKEEPDEEAVQGLLRVAGYLGSPSPHYAGGWAHGTPGGLLMSRVVAQQLAGLGWTQKKIRDFIWEKSKIPADKVREFGMYQWIEQADDAESIASKELDPWPITRTPEQIIMAVAGGHHPTHNYWMQSWSRNVAGGEIHLPAGWDALIAEAEEDLGAGGEHCTI